ncbi:MAG: PEGA domain-containing protein [Polyangiaceae bacterium]
MRRAFRWISFFVAVNVVMPPVAFAQPKKPAKTVAEELPADARREWNAGLTLFGDGNFKAAVTQFQRVYDMTKNPRVLPNLALAHKSNKAYHRAVRVYEQALAEGASVIPAKDQAEIKDAIAALKAYVSTVEVTSNEAGATVTIDGEEVGTTPLAKPVDVSVGPRVIVVSKKNFREQTKTVEVAPGKPASARFELEAEVVMASVTVSIEGPPKAAINIDGTEVGFASPGQPYSGRVAVGKLHTFSATANRYTTAKESLTPATTDPFAIVLRMAEARNEGRVAIIAKPAGALIEIDQKLVGTDKWEGPLSASGGHRIRIHKDGYVDEVQEISVAPDQTRTIDSTLRQDSSRGTVYWAIGTVLVVAAGSLTGYLLATKGRDDAPVPGTLNPPTQATWFHR